MKASIVIKSPAHLKQAARQFISLMAENRVFAFYGEMGAGKTSFIKSLCKEMEVHDSVSSPSFALIYEYFSEKYGSIYHFDLYRIKNQLELYDLGYEDYFYGKGICFIEWPEMAGNLLPPETISVRISVNPDKSRTLKIE